MLNLFTCGTYLNPHGGSTVDPLCSLIYAIKRQVPHFFERVIPLSLYSIVKVLLGYVCTITIVNLFSVCVQSIPTVKRGFKMNGVLAHFFSRESPDLCFTSLIIFRKFLFQKEFMDSHSAYSITYVVKV